MANGSCGKRRICDRTAVCDLYALWCGRSVVQRMDDLLPDFPDAPETNSLSGAALRFFGGGPRFLP